MPAYVIAQISIHDRQEYDRYQAGFLDVLSGYDGEVLAVTEHPQIVEGEWPCTRTVLLRFCDTDEIQRWYDSPQYQEIADHRFRGATTNAVVLQGYEPR